MTFLCVLCDSCVAIDLLFLFTMCLFPKVISGSYYIFLKSHAIYVFLQHEVCQKSHVPNTYAKHTKFVVFRRDTYKTHTMEKELLFPLSTLTLTF